MTIPGLTCSCWGCEWNGLIDCAKDRRGEVQQRQSSQIKRTIGWDKWTAEKREGLCRRLAGLCVDRMAWELCGHEVKICERLGGLHSWLLRSIPRTARMTMLWSKPKGLGTGRPCPRSRPLAMQETANKQLAIPCKPRSAGGGACSMAMNAPHEHGEGGFAGDRPARTKTDTSCRALCGFCTHTGQ